jgi:hypothetical protein
MFPFRGPVVLVSALLGTLPLAPLEAQGSPTLPSAAVLVQLGRTFPSGDLMIDEVREGGWTQSESWSYGAGAEVPLAPRASVQLLLGRSATAVEGTGRAWQGFRGTSRRIETLGKVSYRVTPDARWGFALLAGGGVFWESLRTISAEGTIVPSRGVRTWPVATGGLEGRLRVQEQVTLSLAAEGYLYTARFRGAANSRQAQRDLRITLGVALPLDFR